MMLIEIASNGDTEELDGQYRDFGQYMIGRLEVQEGGYNTDQAGAINWLTQMQIDPERRSNPII